MTYPLSPDSFSMVPVSPQQADLPEILNEYLAGQLTEGTKRIYQRDILDFFEGQVPSLVQLQAVNPRDLIAWRNLQWNGGAGRLEAATINRKLTALKTFYDYLAGMGLVPLNPAASTVVKRIKVKPWQPQLGLLVEEMQALLKSAKEDPNRAAGARDHALISLAYVDLLRRDELSRAKWRDFTRDGGRTILRLPLTKGGANDFVPVEKRVLEILDRYFHELGIEPWRQGWQQENPGGRWTPETIMDCPIFIALDNCNYGRRLSGSGINEVVKKRAQQAKLMSGIHAHTLRHSGITHLLEKGVPLAKVQELARHSDPKITMNYYTLLGRMKDSPTDVLAGHLL